MPIPEEERRIRRLEYEANRLDEALRKLDRRAGAIQQEHVLEKWLFPASGASTGCTGTIDVTVMEPFNRLVAGATVTVSLASTGAVVGTCTTDSAGQCSVPITSAASYVVTATEGVRSATATVAATCTGNPVTLDLTTYYLEGVVTGCVAGRPDQGLAGAVITITDPARGISFTGTTDSAGEYLFAVGEAGPWDWTVAAPPGYLDASGTGVYATVSFSAPGTFFATLALPAMPLEIDANGLLVPAVGCHLLGCTISIDGRQTTETSHDVWSPGLSLTPGTYAWSVAPPSSCYAQDGNGLYSGTVTVREEDCTVPLPGQGYSFGSYSAAPGNWAWALDGTNVGCSAVPGSVSVQLYGGYWQLFDGSCNVIADYTGTHSCSRCPSLDDGTNYYYAAGPFDDPNPLNPHGKYYVLAIGTVTSIGGCSQGYWRAGYVTYTPSSLPASPCAADFSNARQGNLAGGTVACPVACQYTFSPGGGCDTGPDGFNVAQ